MVFKILESLTVAVLANAIYPEVMLTVGFFLFGFFLGEVFAICGSCSTLGNWNPRLAVVLQTLDE